MAGHLIEAQLVHFLVRVGIRRKERLFFWAEKMWRKKTVESGSLLLWLDNGFNGSYWHVLLLIADWSLRGQVTGHVSRVLRGRDSLGRWVVRGVHFADRDTMVRTKIKLVRRVLIELNRAVIPFLTNQKWRIKTEYSRLFNSERTLALRRKSSVVFWN